MQDKYIDRLGEIRQMNCGDYAKIVKYNGSLDVVVEFQDEHKYQKNTEYSDFIKGNVKNVYHPNRYGGYIGDGKYKPTINRKGTYIYDAWIRMLERSKNKKFKEKYSAYQDVDCCNEWMCFQNFAEWYEEHYYTVEGQSMELDKDWINPGNKLYCPECCEIVPSIINSCIVSHPKIKNTGLPTGISRTASNKYKARISINNKRVDLGSYKELSDAITAYKQAKIDYVKLLAKQYKDKIPNIIYQRMINFDEIFERVYPEYATIY